MRKVYIAPDWESKERAVVSEGFSKAESEGHFVQGPGPITPTSITFVKNICDSVLSI
jgi:hypothetical protein